MSGVPLGHTPPEPDAAAAPPAPEPREFTARPRRRTSGAARVDGRGGAAHDTRRAGRAAGPGSPPARAGGRRRRRAMDTVRGDVGAGSGGGMDRLEEFTANRPRLFGLASGDGRTATPVTFRRPRGYAAALSGPWPPGLRRGHVPPTGGVPHPRRRTARTEPTGPPRRGRPVRRARSAHGSAAAGRARHRAARRCEHGHGVRMSRNDGSAESSLGKEHPRRGGRVT